MATDDVFLVRDVQTFLGEQMMNTYTYKQRTGSRGAEDLALAWIAGVLPAIQAIQNNGLVHDYVEVINYNDEGDFYVETLGSGFEGDVSGEPLPKFNAWGYRINRATRAVRNGSKRYAGVSENWLASGVPAGTGVVEALEALADTLAPLLHWRLCHVYDWLYFDPSGHGYQATGVADVYGEDDVRTGCIECNLASQDTALIRLVRKAAWAHLAPLFELKPLYAELKQANGCQPTFGGYGLLLLH